MLATVMQLPRFGALFDVITDSRRRIVAIIMIRCPATGRGVSTGIEVVSTDQLPVVTARLVCPACGSIHEWTKQAAWLASGGDQYRGDQRRKVANG
jgi:hypothetical protein